jgi:starch-binding outer membrane protein, SusD/RagB family
MKNINKFLFITAISASTMMVSCDKRLDLDPRQSIDLEGAYNSPENINAGINAIYGGLRQQTEYGRDKLAVGDALADIAVATGKSGRLQGENLNTQNVHFASWQSSYALLNDINLVLEAIPNVTAETATKERWEGELRFLRALLHHDLAKMYGYDTTAVVSGQYRGSVVLALQAFKDGATASQYRPARASIRQVYEAIYADLDYATEKLTNTRGVNYATKASAHALYARVALFYGDYVKAETQATLALDNIGGVGASLSTPVNYVAGWRAIRNPESIFEVRFNIQNESLGVNVALQTTYTTLVQLGNTSSTGGFGDLVPNNVLLGNLGITSTGFPDIQRGPDVRAQLYEWGTAGRGTRFIETTKFFGKSGFPNLDNVPVIRVPELYLIRAEARLKKASPDEAGALADVNMIRTNRGLTASAATGDDLMEEILLQRMLEYAFEGHRWFDLKRLGRDIVKAQPLAINLPFTDTRILPAIPQREIDGNPNMRQNPGY